MKVAMPEALDFLTMVFFHSTPPVPALDLWKKAFKGMPQGFNQLPNGGAQANGPAGGFQATVITQPGRIDLHLAGEVNGTGVPPVIADSTLAFRYAIGKATALLPPRTDRVAFVAQSSKDEKSLESAVETVKAAVPGLVAPDDAMDLFYQTTVFRESKAVAGVKLTLMPRWNTGRRNLIQLDMTSNGPTLRPAASGSVVSTRYFDVYNADPSSLFPKRAVDILGELAQYAQELLSKGYGSLS